MNITKQEIKEIERVCGKDFRYSDIPSYMKIEDDDETPCPA